jgi:hypothetical protein
VIATLAKRVIQPQPVRRVRFQTAKDNRSRATANQQPANRSLTQNTPANLDKQFELRAHPGLSVRAICARIPPLIDTIQMVTSKYY